MTDTRTTELLPCPFCGGDDLSEGPYSPYVICNGCGAFGPGNSDVTHDEAIKAWNTRTPEQAIAATLGRQKAKAHPYGYEPDTGAFDCTRCECGCINDISAKYCNDCGGEIEIDMYAEKEIYRTPRHLVFAEKHDDGSLEFCERRYVPESATHGMLTAEQVRECAEGVYLEGYSDGSVHRTNHIEETDWQAIADELNAMLRNGECEPTEEHACSACGQDLVACNVGVGPNGGAIELDPPILFNYCPNCGKAVKR